MDRLYSNAKIPLKKIYTYISVVQVVVDTLKNNVIGGDKIDPKAVAVLNLDSGLGVFDAFFASLSMILVSEVCADRKSVV